MHLLDGTPAFFVLTFVTELHKGNNLELHICLEGNHEFYRRERSSSCATYPIIIYLL